MRLITLFQMGTSLKMSVQQEVGKGGSKFKEGCPAQNLFLFYLIIFHHFSFKNIPYPYSVRPEIQQFSPPKVKGVFVPKESVCGQ